MSNVSDKPKSNFPIGKIASLLFPQVALIKLYMSLSKASSIKSDRDAKEWIPKAKRDVLLKIFGYTMILAIVISIGYFSVDREAISKVKFNKKNAAASIAAYKKSLVKNSEGFKRTATAAVVMILLNSTVFLIPEIRKTSKIKKIIKERNGNSEDFFCLCTELGVFVELKGRSAKDLASDESIWRSANLEVDDKNIIEAEGNRSLVLFKAIFKLAKTYDYF